MIHILMTLFVALLFVVLTPGILISLPSETSSKYMIASVHGLIFAIIFHFTHKFAWDFFYGENSIITNIRRNVRNVLQKEISV